MRWRRYIALSNTFESKINRKYFAIFQYGPKVQSDTLYCIAIHTGIKILTLFGIFYALTDRESVMYLEVGHIAVDS